MDRLAITFQGVELFSVNLKLLELSQRDTYFSTYKQES
jgi:hypothetical protein